MPGSASSMSSKKAGRSWFSFNSRRRKRPAIPAQQAPPAPPSAYPGETTPDDIRLGPLQFEPNRIATLYITPSERNLYLAAMEQLDQNPQSLPLWSEPAPTLPGLALSLHPTVDAAIIETAAHPLTSAPMSPKLVTSPELPNGGLQVRDEFRQPQIIGTARPTRHALVSIVPTSFLRFTGFPPETIVAVDRTLAETWPLGVSLRSEDMGTMSRRKGTGEGLAWRVELRGQEWKRKGSRESHSIRLLLGILTTLATHGWNLVAPVQAAGPSKIGHNLVFKYDSQTEARPPVFFAVSLPLPDRISLISMPNKVTPSILTAIRSAIASNAHLVSRSQKGSVTDAEPETPQPKRLTWGSEGKTQGIKIEGWVYPGVYRFWIAGMRRWFGGGIKGSKVDDLHPHLLTKIVDNLHSIDFGLVGSIPLLPIMKGRDVLFFASLPSSGLSYLDTYQGEEVPGAPSTGAETPAVAQTNGQTRAAQPSRNGQHLEERSDTTKGAINNRRVLPWTSILSEDPPNSGSLQGTTASNTVTTSFPPSAVPQNSTTRTKTPDTGPSLTPSGTLSPKSRNVLTKRTSLRRQQSVSGSGSVDLPPPTIGTMSRRGGTRTGDEQWSMVKIPPNVGHLGVSTYEHVPPPKAHVGAPAASAQGSHKNPDGRVQNLSGQAPSNTSGDSVYEESSDAFHQTPPRGLAYRRPSTGNPSSPAEPTQTEFDPPSLALGNALEGSPRSNPSTLPLRKPATGTLNDAKVNVPSTMGIPSMRGSVGFFPGTSVISNDARSEVSLGPLLPPKEGSSRTRLSVGKWSRATR